MKFALKKYLYIINDTTNILLNKERVKADKHVHNLSIVLIVLAILLILSLTYNAYLIFVL